MAVAITVTVYQINGSKLGSSTTKSLLTQGGTKFRVDLAVNSPDVDSSIRATVKSAIVFEFSGRNAASARPLIYYVSETQAALVTAMNA